MPAMVLEESAMPIFDWFCFEACQFLVIYLPEYPVGFTAGMNGYP
jgi:hypothetical protein